MKQPAIAARHLTKSFGGKEVIRDCSLSVEQGSPCGVLGLSAEHYGAAESAMGVAAVLGSLFVGVMGQRLGVRWLAFAFVGLGLCLIPAGLAFVVPLKAFGVYLVLMAMFCISQFGCSLVSTCAISIIQARTPEHLMAVLSALLYGICRLTRRRVCRTLKVRR